MRNLILAICLFSLPVNGFAVTQITSNGITWDFNADVKSGQFCNGDYWVIGPVTITSITPGAKTQGSRALNGSVINPVFGINKQGFDGYGPYVTYDASLNKGLNMPLTVNVNSSLISTVSNPTSDNVAHAVRPFLNYAVLTVLAAAPPEGSFRPSVYGTDKTITHNKSELYTDSSRTAYRVLKSLPYVASKYPSEPKPTLSKYEEFFKVPMIEIMGGWTQMDSVYTAFKGTGGDNQPYYGQWIADATGQAGLLLNMDYTVSQKEKLLIEYVQYGLDLYGALKSGTENARGNWIGEGGHGHGRKLPIMLAGEILQDTGIRAIWPKTGDYLYSQNYYGSGAPNIPSDYIHFGEDDQTFYVTAWEVKNATGYNSANVGLAEWGFSHSNMPNQAVSNWSAPEKPGVYRYNSSQYVATALAARIMGFKDLWNHNVFFDYTDRVKATHTANYDFGDWFPFVSNIWDKYRAEGTTTTTAATTTANTTTPTTIPPTTILPTTTTSSTSTAATTTTASTTTTTTAKSCAWWDFWCRWRNRK